VEEVSGRVNNSVRIAPATLMSDSDMVARINFLMMLTHSVTHSVTQSLTHSAKCSVSV
jgi:hypothetical protein